VNNHASGASQGGYDARQKIEELRRKKSTTAGDNDGFPACMNTVWWLFSNQKNVCLKNA
jgi:hypothetical protein